MTKSMGIHTLIVETMMSLMSFSCVDLVNPCLLVYLNFNLKEVSTLLLRPFHQCNLVVMRIKNACKGIILHYMGLLCQSGFEDFVRTAAACHSFYWFYHQHASTY